jgi:DNA-binding XRE family transcriptional regulator
MSKRHTPSRRLRAPTQIGDPDPMTMHSCRSHIPARDGGADTPQGRPAQRIDRRATGGTRASPWVAEPNRSQIGREYLGQKSAHQMMDDWEEVTSCHALAGLIVVQLGDIDRPTLLREVLRRSGLTQTQLAACLEISREHLNHMVHGRRPIPRHIVLGALAIAMAGGVGVKFRDPYRQLEVIAKSSLMTRFNLRTAER